MGTNIKNPLTSPTQIAQNEVITRATQTMRFELEVQIHRTLGFTYIQKVIRNILIAETGSQNQQDLFNNIFTKAPPKDGVAKQAVTDYFKILPERLPEHYVNDPNGLRRAKTLTAIYNQITDWQLNISDWVGKAFEVALADHDGEYFDPNAIRTAVLQSVQPQIDRSIKRQGDWFGMVGASLKDYLGIMPPQIRSLFTQGTAPPGGLVGGGGNSGRRSHRRHRRSHKRRRH